MAWNTKSSSKHHQDEQKITNDYLLSNQIDVVWHHPSTCQQKRGCAPLIFGIHFCSGLKEQKHACRITTFHSLM
jgi:hypothetical protein